MALMDATCLAAPSLEARLLRSGEGDVVTLELTGELDRGTSRRLCAAVAMARRIASRTIIIDASGLTFVDLGGYRTLALVCGHPHRKRPLNVVLVPGRAVGRLQRMLARCDGAVTSSTDEAATAAA
jgi:ABC-type transporter Mla MlaB component